MLWSYCNPCRFFFFFLHFHFPCQEKLWMRLCLDFIWQWKRTHAFAPYYSLLLSPCLVFSPSHSVYYFLLPLPPNTNKLCFPQCHLSPSLPIVICLILMSCFVLMPSFSSPLLLFLSSRSFCLSPILRHSFSLYLVIFRLPISLSNWDVYPIMRYLSKLWRILSSSHSLWAVSLLFISVRIEILLWLNGWSVTPNAVRRSSSFHCWTKVICGLDVLCDLTHTGFVWPFHSCFSWFSEKVL